MKKENISKSTACAVIMCTALCLGACGANAGDNPNTIIMENPASDGAQEGESSTAEGNAEPSAEGSDQESDAENDTSVIDAELIVTVAMESADEAELTTDDGTVFYTITCSYPVVSIAGNEAAAEKINEDILTRVESFHTATNESIEYAKEDFEYMLSEKSEYTPMPSMPYSSDLSFAVTRADNHVISFTENGYEYTGGAHGMPYSIGINYDTNTGELISFTELSDDPDAFRANTLAYNQALAQTEYYSDQLFNTDDITNGTLEETLYSDGMWYLSTSGLVFMSPPYALAPYAAGTLEFTIPYGDLAAMGLKDQYAYTGRQIVKLRENEPYSTDLNGDGNEESVSYYSAWVDDETDSYSYLTHLMINGTDFSQDGTDDVKEQLDSALSSIMGVCLYDLDVNDNYVELAILLVDWIHNEEDINPVANYHSQFFRYTQHGSLIYLGQAEGDITDPTLSVTASDIRNENE